MTKIVLVDLFSGIGGFAEGFRRAGVEFEYHAFSEIAPGPISIYKKHFPEAEELGDVGAIRDFSRIKQQQGGGTACRYCGISLPRFVHCWQKTRS